MIEGWRKGGGRAYALAAFAIGAVLALALYYITMLVWAMATKGLPLTPELASPLTIAIVVIGGLGGAQVLPNVAERWGGKQMPPPPPPES